MRNKIVVGLGFGDEGKGLTTSFLSESNPDAIVIRHNGGQQAGHTVHYNKKVHVFSQLGAGSLQGLPTYFTSDCTFYPPSFLPEWKLVKDSLKKDILYLHPETMITLPIDISFNRTCEEELGKDRHGSVGMGFGATIERNERHFNLYAKDLLYSRVLKAKIENIYKYYYKVPVELFADDINYFMDCVSKLDGIISLCTNNEIIDAFPKRIFETAQGVLLDQHHGFFPNVTRSNTTSKNALKFLKSETGLSSEIYYVTRCYQTRHGAGYMSNEDGKLTLKNNSMETNVSHEYQGEFRVAPLDIEHIIYAIKSDNTYSYKAKKNLIITCLDQVETFSVKYLVDKILKSMGRGFTFDRVILSYGPSIDTLVE